MDIQKKLRLDQKVLIYEIVIRPKEYTLNDLLDARLSYMEEGVKGSQRKKGIVRHNKTDDVLYIMWEDGSKDTVLTTPQGTLDPDGMKVLEVCAIY